MFAEKYKRANDSIRVSDERKEELLSMIKAEAAKKERTKRLNAAGLLAAGLVIVFVACAVAVTGNNKAVKIDKTSTDESETAIEKMFFNEIDGTEKEKFDGSQFDVAGEGEYKRSELPEFLSAVLPNLPDEYEKSEGLFEASYSENWDEFYVNASASLDGGTVSVCAERGSKNGEKIPQNWVESKLSNSKYNVYLTENLQDGESLISANYVTDDGILISITTDELEKSEFVKFVGKCLEKADET